MPRYTTRDSSEGSGEKLAGAIVAGFTIAPLVLLFAFVPAWVLMLALGVAHDQWPVIPNLGYWTTYILLAGLGVALGPFKRHSSS